MPSFVCQVRGWRKPVHFSVTKQPPAGPIHQNSWAGLIAHCWRAQSCPFPHPPPSPGTSLTHQEPPWRLWIVFPGLARRADSLRTWMIPRGPFLPILFHKHCSRCTREPQGAQEWKSGGKKACSYPCWRALLSGELVCLAEHHCCLYTLTDTGSPLPHAPGPKGWQQRLLKWLVVSTSTLRVAQLAHLGRKGCLAAGAASFQEHLANIMVLLGWLVQLLQRWHKGNQEKWLRQRN